MEWTKGRDIQEFEYEDTFGGYELTVACNLDSWEECKILSENKPLYISGKQDKHKIFIGLSLEDMIKLKDYLIEKIDYLTE